MRKIHLALIGAATLALTACGGPEEDALDENVGESLEANELDALAENAAADAAAEMDALGNQLDELEAAPVEDTTNEALEGVTTEPSEVEDDPLGM